MSEKREKLKSVLNQVPAGCLVDSTWFTEQGISRVSVAGYIKSGWISRVIRGLYRRPPSTEMSTDEVLSWETVIVSAQWLMEYDFHVGGMTALHLFGHSHFLRLSGRPSIHVYGDGIPAWLVKVPSDASFVEHTRGLFDKAELAVGDTLSSNFQRNIPHERNPTPWLPWISAPERAILEAIDTLPRHADLDAIDLVFENLTGLRPNVLNALLVSCTRVKTKRLFMMLADRHGHGWCGELNRRVIDLGRGPRSLYPGGRMHPVYEITVPEKYLPVQTEALTHV